MAGAAGRVLAREEGRSLANKCYECVLNSCEMVDVFSRRARSYIANAFCGNNNVLRNAAQNVQRVFSFRIIAVVIDCLTAKISDHGSFFNRDSRCGRF